MLRLLLRPSSRFTLVVVLGSPFHGCPCLASMTEGEEAPVLVTEAPAASSAISLLGLLRGVSRPNFPEYSGLGEGPKTFGRRDLRRKGANKNLFFPPLFTFIFF